MAISQSTAIDSISEIGLELQRLSAVVRIFRDSTRISDIVDSRLGVVPEQLRAIRLSLSKFALENLRD